VLLDDDARWLLSTRIAENQSFSLVLDGGAEVSGVVELHVLLDSSEACLHACALLGTSSVLCEVLREGMETKRNFLRVRAIYAAAVNTLVRLRESQGRRFFFVQIGAHVGNTTNDPIFDHANHQGREWAGVLVEPNQKHFTALQRNYDLARQHRGGGRSTELLLFENAAVCGSGKDNDSSSSATFYTVPSSMDQDFEFSRPAWLDQIDSLDQPTFRRNLRLVLEQQQQQQQQQQQIGNPEAEQMQVPIDARAEAKAHELDELLDSAVAASSTHVECIQWAKLVEKARTVIPSTVEGSTPSTVEPMAVDALYVDCEGMDAAIVREVLAYAQAAQLESHLHARLPSIMCFEHAHLLRSDCMSNRDDEDDELLLGEELRNAGYICGRRGAEDTCCVVARLFQPGWGFGSWVL
jgi:hypothetical protein